jgi:uncharacterized protein YxeA
MKLTPSQLQEQLTAISEESYEKHQELADIVMRSADIKMQLMKESKSNAEVMMKYAATEDGKREAYLKIYLKGLGHKRTSIIQEVKANSGSSY